jgi:hypothetical protein
LRLQYLLGASETYEKNIGSITAKKATPLKYLQL